MKNKKEQEQERKSGEEREKDTGGGMEEVEAEVGERRGVGEALKDAVEVAGVAEVLQP